MAADLHTRRSRNGKLEKLGPFRGHGTTIYFEPDATIFKTTHFDADVIKAHLEDMSYIHSGLKITFKNEVTGETFDLTHPGGIPEFLTRLDHRRPEAGRHRAAVHARRATTARRWKSPCSGPNRPTRRSAPTSTASAPSSGGTHENGFKSGIVKAIRNYMETHEIKIKGLTITAEDIREGIVGILSVFVREPMFQGQTKEKLNNPEMTAAVENFVRPALETWLNANTTAADQIVGRIVLAARARLASREAASEVKRKSATSRRLNLPGKLADCKSTDLGRVGAVHRRRRLGRRLGQAGPQQPHAGRAAAARQDPQLRRACRLRKVLANQELNDLVTAIGTGAGDKFNIDGLRYGKIILLMDADADGHHITTLLLTFFFRHMTELIRKGHVYIAQPPLYRIDVGKETHWARDDAHKEEILAKLRANAKPEVTRFKGLGEMDANELKETTLDRRNRTLLKVEIDNPLKADKTFDHLLGKDASHRYREIMDNADKVAAEEIDV